MNTNEYIQGSLNFQEVVDKGDYDLVKYGIFEENSDIRAHVSDKVIFVFKTNEVIKAIKENEYPLKYAYQPGYDKPTAYGYVVKYIDVKDIRILKFISWDGWILWNNDWRTTEKGRWAVQCVIDLLKIGRFPLWLETSPVNDTRIDIKGTDILIVMNQRIQVKCDYPAIKTGNLYMQTHEKNPFKFY